MITLLDRTIQKNEAKPYYVKVWNEAGQEVHSSYDSDWLFEILTNNSDQAQIITEDYLLAHVSNLNLRNLNVQVFEENDNVD